MGDIFKIPTVRRPGVAGVVEAADGMEELDEQTVSGAINLEAR